MDTNRFPTLDDIDYLLAAYRRGRDPLAHVERHYRRVASKGGSVEGMDAGLLQRVCDDLSVLAAGMQRFIAAEKRAQQLRLDTTNPHLREAQELAASGVSVVPGRSAACVILGYLALTEQLDPGSQAARKVRFRSAWKGLRHGHTIQPGVYAVVVNGSREDGSPILTTNALTATASGDSLRTAEMVIHSDDLPACYLPGIPVCGGNLFLRDGVEIRSSFTPGERGVPRLHHSLFVPTS